MMTIDERIEIAASWRCNRCCRNCASFQSWRDYMGDDDPEEPTDCGKCFAEADKATNAEDVCDKWTPNATNQAEAGSR